MRTYKGNYWAVVVGPRDPQIVPSPVLQWLETGDKKTGLEIARELVAPGSVLRVVRQPNDGKFKEGM